MDSIKVGIAIFLKLKAQKSSETLRFFNQNHYDMTHDNQNSEVRIDVHY
jgi:hypothetical protein